MQPETQEGSLEAGPRLGRLALQQARQVALVRRVAETGAADAVGRNVVTQRERRGHYRGAWLARRRQQEAVHAACQARQLVMGVHAHVSQSHEIYSGVYSSINSSSPDASSGVMQGSAALIRSINESASTLHKACQKITLLNGATYLQPYLTQLPTLCQTAYMHTMRLTAPASACLRLQSLVWLHVVRSSSITEQMRMAQAAAHPTAAGPAGAPATRARPRRRRQPCRRAGTRRAQRGARTPGTAGPGGGCCGAPPPLSASPPAVPGQPTTQQFTLPAFWLDMASAGTLSWRASSSVSVASGVACSVACAAIKPMCNLQTFWVCSGRGIGRHRCLSRLSSVSVAASGLRSN